MQSYGFTLKADLSKVVTSSLLGGNMCSFGAHHSGVVTTSALLCDVVVTSALLGGVVVTSALLGGVVACVPLGRLT